MGCKEDSERLAAQKTCNKEKTEVWIEGSPRLCVLRERARAGTCSPNSHRLLSFVGEVRNLISNFSSFSLLGDLIAAGRSLSCAQRVFTITLGSDRDGVDKMDGLLGEMKKRAQHDESRKQMRAPSVDIIELS